MTLPRLRVWPAILIVALMWIVILVVPRVARETMIHFRGMPLAPLGGTFCMGIWWVFLSRATRMARWGGAGLFLVGLLVMFGLAHESMQVALVLHIIPRILTSMALLTLVVNSIPNWRQLSLGAGAIALALTVPLTLRTASLDGDMNPEFSWRWSASPTIEAIDISTPLGDVKPLVADADDWPEFRGPERDSRVTGLRIATDWATNPPIELWRIPIGEGWSSMAVVGDYLFTQEQRGDQELVTAYNAANGEALWADGISSRFFDAISGTGPRGTPTFADGRLYSISARGVVFCHDAASGERIWSHDLMAEHNAPLPDWGFAGSPEVYDGIVIVYIGIPDGAGLIGYDAISGEQKWAVPAGSISYSAPHLLTLHETPQIVMLHTDGVTSHDPRSGKQLWQHDWPIHGRYRIVQPLLLDGNRLLIGTSFDEGTRLLQINFDGNDWSVEQGWTSRGMKPYFNDFATYQGHLYGFDTNILGSIDLADGSRDWKRGRYGHGQLLLLADQGLLLVLSEQGELALVEANPDEFIELARIEVLGSKTWNHPAIVGNTLYVRSDREMAAYRLPSAN